MLMAASTSVTYLVTRACTLSVSLSSTVPVPVLFLYSRVARHASLRPDNTRRPPWHRLVTLSDEVARERQHRQ